MIKRTIYEYGQIQRSEIPAPILRLWQRFDEQHALRTGDTIFDWNHLHFVKAKSYVGVVQVAELQIEILPKTDNDPISGTLVTESGFRDTRQNFLYMLSMTGRLPFHERDLASQKLRRLPLWEALIRAFAGRLLTELRRGQPHAYQYREENLTCVRGRILIQRQLSQNSVQRHKIQVGYDEFSNDTLLNRILRASCARLLGMTSFVETQQLLREGLLELADVAEQIVAPHDFESVKFDRNSERFRELLEFCRLVFLGMAPSLEIGAKTTFSLLFPMEVLFEEFVGGCLKRFADALGYRRSDVHLQAASKRRWLLKDAHGQGKFRLKPDVLISGDSDPPQLILDTKWKRLLSDEVDSKNGIQQADMYQLYAYATRYQCGNNVLLFPRISGVTSKSYVLADDSQTKLRVEFLDLNFDLRRERDRLVANFRQILNLLNCPSTSTV
jgi:5-methylcytosine-specific restriction enzyme subunit McrC